MLGDDAFQGTLKAVASETDNTVYQLWNGKKKIVLTSEVWDKQNTDHKSKKGLKFALLSQADYDLQVARDNAGSNDPKYIVTDKFQISSTLPACIPQVCGVLYIPSSDRMSFCIPYTFWL